MWDCCCAVGWKESLAARCMFIENDSGSAAIAGAAAARPNQPDGHILFRKREKHKHTAGRHSVSQPWRGRVTQKAASQPGGHIPPIDAARMVNEISNVRRPRVLRGENSPGTRRFRNWRAAKDRTRLAARENIARRRCFTVLRKSLQWNSTRKVFLTRNCKK